MQTRSLPWTLRMGRVILGRRDEAGPFDKRRVNSGPALRFVPSDVEATNMQTAWIEQPSVRAASDRRDESRDGASVPYGAVPGACPESVRQSLC